MASLISFDARSTISGLNTCVNTYHVFAVPGITLSEVNALLAPFKTFYDAFAAQRATGTSFTIGSRVLFWQDTWWTKPVGKPGQPGYVKGFFNTPPTIYAATTLASTSGTGGNPLPPQLASVISWKTSSAGRSYRGRTYLGNLGQSAMSTSGGVIGTALTAFNNAAAALLTNIAGVPVSGGLPALGIWSPTLGKLTTVLTGSSDTTFDTMRSRVK